MLLASLCLSALASGTASPRSVGPIALEDLWRRSEVVVLGRVGGVDGIAVVEVQRVFRGPEDLKSVLVSATPTSSCDVTHLEPGETAFFLLDRTGVTERGGEVFQVAWEGRGRMPVRRVGDQEWVDFWPAVRMPENLTLFDHPILGCDFAGTVALADLSATLGGFASLASRPLLAATAFSSGGSDLSWDMLLAEDGWCRLTIHGRPYGKDGFPDPRRDRHRVFRVSEERIEKLNGVLRTEWSPELTQSLGSDSYAWQRELRWLRRVPTEDGGTQRVDASVKIAPLDAARMSNPEVRRHTVAALRIWRELRGVFDVPGCVDLRPDDARWID